LLGRFSKTIRNPGKGRAAGQGLILLEDFFRGRFRGSGRLDSGQFQGKGRAFARALALRAQGAPISPAVKAETMPVLFGGESKINLTS
jgi:hypothetical protein